MWKYNLYYDSCWLHEGTDFETEEDAMEDAQMHIGIKIESWMSEGCEWEEELFEIVTDEYKEEVTE